MTRWPHCAAWARVSGTSVLGGIWEAPHLTQPWISLAASASPTPGFILGSPRALSTHPALTRALGPFL